MSKSVKLSGSVERIGREQRGNHTQTFILLKGHAELYRMGSNGNDEMCVTTEGDFVSFEYYPAEGFSMNFVNTTLQSRSIDLKLSKKQGY